ncbi:hypothetical protein GZH53_17220 [Flavihumibacter sp. R14]|nr:hypothetical protein [Flavihumibacter soli]
MLIACLAGLLTFFAGNSNAQVSINFNVGAQPVWGPTGYDRADYYYLPDIDTYYYVPKKQYVYLQDNRWTFNNALPARYSGYNLYNGYKVVLNSPKPYLYNSSHKVKYARYKGNKVKQPTIRYSNDPKYYIVKGHPKYKGVAPGQAKKLSSASGKSHNQAAKGNGQGKQNNGEKKGKGKGKK